MAAFSILSWLFLAAGFYTGSLLFFLRQRNMTALAFLVAGTTIHAAVLLCRGFSFGIFTPLNIFTELYFLPWLLGVFTLYRCLPRLRSPRDPYLLVPLTVLTLVAIPLATKPLPPFLQSGSPFATLFFFFEVTAHAAFLLGGWFSYLFLTGKTGEQNFDRYTTWGFILYSVAQVTGAIWCYQGWAVPFSWSERHLISAAIWCFYCAYLHVQFSPRWKVREKAWFALVGSIFITITIYAYYLASSGDKNA